MPLKTGQKGQGTGTCPAPGVGAALAIKTIAHWPIAIETWTIVMSFLVCTFTGIFFGWYPAKKAAMLDSIEALRYE